MYARIGFAGLLVVAGCSGGSAPVVSGLSAAAAPQEPECHVHETAAAGATSDSGAPPAASAGASGEAKTGGSATGGAGGAGAAGTPAEATGGTSEAMSTATGGDISTGGRMPTGGRSSAGGRQSTGGHSSTGGSAPTGGAATGGVSTAAAGSSQSGAGVHDDGAAGSAGASGGASAGGSPQVQTEQVTLELPCSHDTLIASSSWDELETGIVRFGACSIESANWIPDPTWDGTGRYNLCTSDGTWDPASVWEEPASGAQCDSNFILAECCGMWGSVRFVVNLTDPTHAE